MRILFLGKPYFVNELIELGHVVEHVSFRERGRVSIEALPMPIAEVLEQLQPDFEPDAVLLGDESIHPIFVGLEALDIPVGWVAVDSHIHMDWHRDYAAAFDVIAVAQKSYVDGYRFDASRQYVHWSPLFARSDLLGTPKVERDLDVCFVGSLNKEINPERVELIDALKSRVSIHVDSGDFVETFQRSRMILNQCLNNDVNFRTFEAMACGGLLLMERVGNGLSELFEEGKHFAGYDRGNIDGLVETIDYYLAHPELCEQVAAAGRKEVLEKHTAIVRAKTWAEALASEMSDTRVTARLNNRGEIEQSVSKAYRAAAMAYETAGITRMAQGYVELIEQLAK